MGLGLRARVRAARPMPGKPAALKFCRQPRSYRKAIAGVRKNCVCMSTWSAWPRLEAGLAHG